MTPFEHDLSSEHYDLLISNVEIEKHEDENYNRYRIRGYHNRGGRENFFSVFSQTSTNETQVKKRKSEKNELQNVLDTLKQHIVTLGIPVSVFNTYVEASLYNN